jgi:hypothetical protein
VISEALKDPVIKLFLPRSVSDERQHHPAGLLRLRLAMLVFMSAYPEKATEGR